MSAVLATPDRASRYSKAYTSRQNIPGVDASEQSEWQAQYAVRDLLPSHAAAQCGKFFHGAYAELRVKDGEGFLLGMSACKSTWVCPRCSSFLGSHRRRRLDRLVRAGMANGVRVLMVTYTFSHRISDALADILARASDAMKSLRAGRFGVQLRQRFGVLGYARGTEVMDGQNGWHPHYHELVFLPASVDVDEFRAFMKSAWVAALARQGLDASEERGCDVAEADSQVAAYVAKFGKMPRWSPGAEAAGGRRKSGRAASRSPWQLLADASAGDARAAARFCEYAAAMSGRPQLYVSPGLYAALGVAEDREDFDALVAEDAAEKRDGSELVCKVKAVEWLAVWHCRSVGRLFRAAALGEVAARAVIAECWSLAIERGLFLDG